LRSVIKSGAEAVEGVFTLNDAFLDLKIN
jgi:hypothetical protein